MDRGGVEGDDVKVSICFLSRTRRRFLTSVSDCEIVRDGGIVYLVGRVALEDVSRVKREMGRMFR